MNKYVLIALLSIIIICSFITIYILVQLSHYLHRADDAKFQELQRDIKDDISDLNRHSSELITNQMNSIYKYNEAQNSNLVTGLNNMQKGTLDSLGRIYRNMDSRLEGLNSMFTNQLRQMRKENNEQIDRIRASVEEKLDKTLTSQVEKSFNNVILHMTELQKSMVELQSLSGKVSDLDKSLNGIKTRGIMGEIQLKSIIEDILTPNQYDIEVPTIPNSNNHVEIAIKIPYRDSDGFAYLPIDSKCHMDKYEQLLNAYDSSDKNAIEEASKAFARAIIEDSKTIRDKYILEPYTTPYAILFVPFEGMYSEIVRMNLLERINSYNITVAGPYSLTAILGTITNYWQALIIEKKSDDIRHTLEKVKSEFNKFNNTFEEVQKNLNRASTSLETLQSTRLNAMQRALNKVGEYPTISE